MTPVRISQKTQPKIQTLKIFIFDILFVFTTNSLSNPIVLLILDLLQLLIIPYLYVHPIYSHLTIQPAFAPYFSNIFPYLFYVKADGGSDNFPVCLLVYAVCVVMLGVLRKNGANVLIMGVEIVLALLPVLLLRVVSQAMSIVRYGIVLRVFAIIFMLFTLVAVVLVLAHYKKPLKLLDVLAAILLHLNVNQYAVMSYLGTKIILCAVLQSNMYGKYIKVALQSSLLCSLVLLVFVQPVLLNYIMVGVLVGVCALYGIFRVYVGFQLKNISRIKVDEDDQYCTESEYTWTELQYFQRMNRHINQCVQAQCTCRQLLHIHDLKQLKKWAPAFRKNQLKIKALCSDSPDARHLAKPQTYFNQQIQYIQACLQAEQPDFFGYIKLHELHPRTVAQQYSKYSNMKKYSLYLQKSTPKILNMSIVNQTQDSNPYNQLLNLQNQICQLIQKVKQFWKELLNYSGDDQFAQLIEEISDDINKIHGMYDTIEQNYDEKQQADYYYNIFKLLTLHQRPSAALIDNHKSKYIMVTKGDTIINVTVNITHLMQRSRQQLIGHKYTTLMSQVYANEHSQWVRQYMHGYRPSQDNNFIKVINITNTNIKVVHMTHLLVPCLGSDIQVEADHTHVHAHSGVNVISLIYQKQDDDDIDLENQQLVFHMLVCRNTLDVIAFEDVVFQFFDQKPTTDNLNKILRSNLKKIFPNLNKQALLKKGENMRKLIAKYNKHFFDNQDFKTKQSIAKYSLAQASQGPAVFRKSKQKLLHVEQVYNEKNQKLNLVLLKFETIMQKEQKQTAGKKTSQDLQLDLLKKKTLKNIMQSTKQQKNKSKQTDQGLIWCKLFLCLSFIIAFALNVTMFTLFEIQYDSLSSLLQKWSKKQKIYTDLQYTQAYFLNFNIGENRISEMQKYWNYNTQYVDIITIFKQINQRSFNLKFLQYVQRFQQTHLFADLNTQIYAKIQSMKYVQKAIFILFYCVLGLIAMNLFFSIVTFLKSLSKSIDILSSFLKFDESQISSNLKRIQGLETLLQLHDFKEMYEQEMIKQKQLQEIQSSSPFIKQHKMSSINSLTKMESTIVKTKSKTQFKDDKKINFHLILNNYFANQSGNKQGDQTSLSRIGQKQLNKRKQVRISSNRQKNRSKQKQAGYTDTNQINQNNQQNNKQYPLSMMNSISKNRYNLIAPLSGFILKLVLAITLILFIKNVMNQTIKCVQLKHRLVQQPTLMVKTLQQQYFSDQKQYDLRLIFYYFENVQRMSKLPSQFGQFKQFQQVISTTIKNLCEYIDRSRYDTLYLQCKSRADIFRSGMETVIEFIQERIRQTAIGTLPKSYLKQKNQMTLSVQVIIYIMNLRNIQYMKAYELYYEKYRQIKFLIRIIYMFVFLCCLYLQVKELQYTSQKTKKTQNLFKIVPPFMKNQLEQSHISKKS